ncbi:hypothetical protein B0H13DRAFT_1872061 [Mycena leptocephala]|nr:hypothetical protein B0H13DRAFT_1872061 [Mycena leptocephala]
MYAKIGFELVETKTSGVVTDHFYTISTTETDSAVKNGYVLKPNPFIYIPRKFVEASLCSASFLRPEMITSTPPRSQRGSTLLLTKDTPTSKLRDTFFRWLPANVLDKGPNSEYD